MFGTRKAYALADDHQNEFNAIQDNSRSRDVRAMSAVNDILTHSRHPFLSASNRLRRARSVSQRRPRRSMAANFGSITTAPMPTSHLVAHRPTSAYLSSTAPIHAHYQRRAYRQGSLPPVERTYCSYEPHGLDYGYYPPPANSTVYMNGDVCGPTHRHNSSTPPSHYIQRVDRSHGYHSATAPCAQHTTSHIHRHLHRPTGLPSGKLAQRPFVYRNDELLNYKLPPTEYYQDMKKSLRGVTEKMARHRVLLDRYAGIDMASPGTVEDRISQKYNDLCERMPGQLEKVVAPQKFDTYIVYGPRTAVRNIPTALSAPTHNKNLHGKIKKLIHTNKRSMLDYVD